MRLNQRSWCVITVLALAIASCTESFKPDVSTETGNPPVIDSDLIALVVTSDEVHVRGEAGAVTPPQGEVEVTTVRNQEVTTGRVDDDGSFDIQVDATINDVFEVRAVSGGERSNAVIVVRGGAQVGEGDGGTLSCEQQVDIARSVLEQAVSSADKSCATNEDCLPIGGSTGCFEGCERGYASEAGIESLNAVVEALNGGFCESYEDDCGELFALPCVGPLPALCDDGQCIQDEGTAGTCGNVCFSDDSLGLSFRISSAGILPATPGREQLRIQYCNDLTWATIDGPIAPPLCILEVDLCDTGAGRPSIEGLRSALAHPDVVAALEAGGVHGAPEDESGYVYEIEYQLGTITYRSCAEPGCDVPAGLEALRVLLDDFRVGYQCPPDVDCTSDFDPGPSFGAQQVWWHDPMTGTCYPRTYGLTGGNGNRYDTLASCQSACPPPLSNADCRLGRSFKTLCYDCNSIEICEDLRGTCALECSRNEDCQNEQSQWALADGSTFCDTTTDFVCKPVLICE